MWSAPNLSCAATGEQVFARTARTLAMGNDTSINYDWGDLDMTITRSERNVSPKPAPDSSKSKHQFVANELGQCVRCGRRERDVNGRKTHK